MNRTQIAVIDRILTICHHRPSPRARALGGGTFLKLMAVVCCGSTVVVDVDDAVVAAAAVVV